MLKGRRIPVQAGADPALMVTQPGDYYGPVMGFSGDRPAVFFIPPAGSDGLHHVCSPPHVFTEEQDGLTIRESIGCGPPPYYWHGYLTNGTWTSC